MITTVLFQKFEFPEDDFDFGNAEIPSNICSNGSTPSVNIDTPNVPKIEKEAVQSPSSEFVAIKTPLKAVLPDTLASWSPSLNENVPAVNIDCSKLPLIEKEDGSKVSIDTNEFSKREYFFIV